MHYLQRYLAPAKLLGKAVLTICRVLLNPIKYVMALIGVFVNICILAVLLYIVSDELFFLALSLW